MCSIASSPSELGGCNSANNNNNNNSVGSNNSNASAVVVGNHHQQLVSMGSSSDMAMTQVAMCHVPHDAHHDGLAGTAGNELTVYDVIMCVSQAHRLNCSYTEELTRELMRRPVTVPQNGVSNHPYLK